MPKRPVSLYLFVMRLNRFIGEFDLSGDFVSITSKDQISQIKNVLRLKVGDFLVLASLSGEAKAEILGFSDKDVKLKIVERIAKEDRQSKEVHLYLSILKKDNFELAVQKATECSISSVTPIVSEHTVKLGLNLERLKKIAKEASEQSGRLTVPTINDSLTLKVAVEALPDNDLNIVFDPEGIALNSFKSNTFLNTNLFIGPEGGWSDGEIDNFRTSHKFTILNLGDNILRAETAAVVTSYLFSQIYA